MNREEILAMEAGDDLDALVAKEIMGLEVSFLGTTYPSIMISKGVWSPLIGYSTDISAAWQVVEKMFEEGWREQELSRCHRTGVWEAKFGIIDAGYAESFSLPEAICKAALLAKYSSENTLEKKGG